MMLCDREWCHQKKVANFRFGAHPVFLKVLLPIKPISADPLGKTHGTPIFGSSFNK